MEGFNDDLLDSSNHRQYLCKKNFSLISVLQSVAFYLMAQESHANWLRFFNLAKYRFSCLFTHGYRKKYVIIILINEKHNENT